MVRTHIHTRSLLATKPYKDLLDIRIVDMPETHAWKETLAILSPEEQAFTLRPLFQAALVRVRQNDHHKSFSQRIGITPSDMSQLMHSGAGSGNSIKKILDYYVPEDSTSPLSLPERMQAFLELAARQKTVAPQAQASKASESLIAQLSDKQIADHLGVAGFACEAERIADFRKQWLENPDAPTQWRNLELARQQPAKPSKRTRGD